MGKDLGKVQRIAFICNGSSCLKKGADDTTANIRSAIAEHQLKEKTHTIRTQCTGQCEHGPVVFIHPDGIWYKEVFPDQSHLLVEQHLLNSEPLASSIFHAS